jgi:cytochrome c-type biogenesis protein CcmH/NrfF
MTYAPRLSAGTIALWGAMTVILGIILLAVVVY